MTRGADLQRLLAEEPFVRALAASLCAADADDVVQQTYLRALQSHAGALARPRHWLARVVRNLAIDAVRRRVRRDARHAAQPQVASCDARVPSSAELLEAEEARRELVAAVDALPELQRAVVLLRWYEGLPPRRIATRLRVPAATVRHRLHDALQTLRRRLDARHGGDRRAWLLPLVPFATSPRALPWRDVTAAPTTPALTPQAALGAIAMTTKTKVAAALAVALLCAVSWLAWPRVADADVPAPRAPDAAVVEHGALPAGAAGSTERVAPVREAAPAAAAAPARATTGTLLVHVAYRGEPAKAAGIGVTVSPAGGDFRVGARHAATDGDGTARFDALPPGEHRVRCGVQPELSARAEVAAGGTSECSLVLRDTFVLSGVVVDGAGVPVAGAIVEACVGNLADVDAAPIAVTGADGTFAARFAGPCVLVGARAPGLAASQLYYREVAKGQAQHVRIELLTRGGSVEGIVVGPSGAPVADAVVRVGAGWTESLPATPAGGAPLPAQVRTDGDGRFRAIGVPAGTQPLLARAPALAPWSGSCEVAAGLTAGARIVMTDGVTCTGVVRRDDGQPVAGARIRVGRTGDFALIPARSAGDGSFTLRGLPVGDVDVDASHAEHGDGSVRIRGAAGETVRRDVVISSPRSLRGRVLGDADAPVAMALVECRAEGDGPAWRGSAHTSGDGRFTVGRCPAGRLLTVDVTPPGHHPLQLGHVDPAAGELTLRAERDASPHARVTGRVLRPDGSGAVGVVVEASCLEPRRHGGGAVNGADGVFSFTVPAGAWSLRVVAKGHPSVLVPANGLQPGAEWNVGTLQLARGGTLVVRGGGEELSYLVADARGQLVGTLHAPVPPLRSDLLSPGEYRLLVRGDGVAATALPFTIRGEQQVELEVRPASGVRQRFEFVARDARPLRRLLEFEVRRNGELIALHFADSASLTSLLWLAPGDYTLTTLAGDPATTAAFTVGAVEGPLLRVVLR